MKQNDKNISNDYENHINLGIKYIKSGNIAKGITKLKYAINLNDKNYKAYINLANAYLLSKQIDKGIKLLFDFLNKNKTEINVLNHLVKICLQYKLYDKLPKIFKFNNSNQFREKDLYYLYYAQGLFYELRFENKNAINSYKLSISSNPNFFNSYDKLLNLLELSNDIINFENLIKKANKIFHNNKTILYYQALLNNRRKEFKLSEDIILKNNLENHFKNKNYDFERLLNLQSKNNEKLKNYKISYDKIITRNNLIKNYEENKNYNNTAIIDNIHKYKNFYNKKNVKLITNKLNYIDDSNLVFLVAFPRSGTTLLDTILRTHSKITVLEEEPFLIKARHKYFEMNDNKLDSLLKITQLQKDDIRNSYFNEIIKQKYDRKKILIDKLPLSIIELGFIKCIFPYSKIILALRHPCDAVLSCFFSSFKINDAMASFLDFEDTVSFYNEVFNLFEFYENELDLSLHKIKYEETVGDFENSIRNLLKFLDLDYEKPLEKFYQTALNRNRISTPSYSQVVSPLYFSSIGRWKKYSNFINPEKNLKKWIKKFNY